MRLITAQDDPKYKILTGPQENVQYSVGSINTSLINLCYLTIPSKAVAVSPSDLE